MIFLASLTEGIGDKVEGYQLIDTKEKLDRVVCDNRQNNKVIIRKDFAREYFTPTGLSNYIHNVKVLNPNVDIEIDGKSMVLTQSRVLSMLADAVTVDDYLQLMVAYPKEFKDCITFLTRNEEQRQKELLSASGDVSRLHSVIDDLRRDNAELRRKLGIEQENKFYVQSKLSALISRINYQYNADVNESKLFKLDTNRFDKVLYFKEITRVQFMDSFIYYLQEVLKMLYSMPARLVVLESYYASGKEALYQGLKPHYKLTEGDVLSGDILMLGIQPRLMEDILKNPSNISVLLVLDRAGFDMQHIVGRNVEYFYTVSDMKDIPDSIPKTRIISYTEDTLFIPLIDKFDDMDKGQRISAYSSMEIMKKFISLLEGNKVLGKSKE